MKEQSNSQYPDICETISVPLSFPITIDRAGQAAARLPIGDWALESAICEGATYDGVQVEVDLTVTTASGSTYNYAIATLEGGTPVQPDSIVGPGAPETTQPNGAYAGSQDGVFTGIYPLSDLSTFGVEILIPANAVVVVNSITATIVGLDETLCEQEDGEPISGLVKLCLPEVAVSDSCDSNTTTTVEALPVAVQGVIQAIICEPCEAEWTTQILCSDGDYPGTGSGGRDILSGDQVLVNLLTDCNGDILGTRYFDPTDPTFEISTFDIGVGDCPAPIEILDLGCIVDAKGTEWNVLGQDSDGNGQPDPVPGVWYVTEEGVTGVPAGDESNWIACGEEKTAYNLTDRCCFGPAEQVPVWSNLAGSGTAAVPWATRPLVSPSYGGDSAGALEMILDVHPDFPDLLFGGNAQPSNGGNVLNITPQGDAYWGPGDPALGGSSPPQWGYSISAAIANAGCCSKVESFTLWLNDIDNGEWVQFTPTGATVIVEEAGGFSQVVQPDDSIRYTGTANNGALSITWPASSLPQNFLVTADWSAGGGITSFTYANVRSAVETWVKCDDPSAAPLYVDPVTGNQIATADVECSKPNCAEPASETESLLAQILEALTGDGECPCIDPVADKRCMGYGTGVAGYLASSNEAESISNYNDHNDTAPGSVDIVNIADAVVWFRGEVVVDGTAYPWSTSVAALAGGGTPSTTYEYAVVTAMNTATPASTGVQFVHGSTNPAQGNAAIGVEYPDGTQAGFWSEQGYTDGAGGVVWSRVTNWTSSTLGGDTYAEPFIGTDPGVFTNSGDSLQGGCEDIAGPSADVFNPDPAI